MMESARDRVQSLKAMTSNDVKTVWREDGKIQEWCYRALSSSHCTAQERCASELLLLVLRSIPAFCAIVKQPVFPASYVLATNDHVIESMSPHIMRQLIMAGTSVNNHDAIVNNKQSQLPAELICSQGDGCSHGDIAEKTARDMQTKPSNGNALKVAPTHTFMNDSSQKECGTEDNSTSKNTGKGCPSVLSTDWHHSDRDGRDGE
jgi:hypothetical protein